MSTADSSSVAGKCKKSHSAAPSLDPGNCDNSHTYINFSRPQREMRTQTVPERRSRPELESVDENSELDPFAPVKPTSFVRLRVTSNDLTAQSRDAEAIRDDPTAEKVTTVGERILRMSNDKANLVPQPSSAMPNNRLHTWPKKYQEKKAGSYCFDEAPTLTRTPWEVHRAEVNPRRVRAAGGSSKIFAKLFFKPLPQEIYQCILDHLERSYSYGAMVDVARLQTDLRTLCRVDKKWNRVAREYLYRDLWLPVNHTPKKKKFSFQTPRSRFQMLLETLKKSPFLSTLVNQLRVPTDLAADIDAEIAKSIRGPSLQMLTEAILLCSNLEHLSGFVPPVGPVSLNLLSALSTRYYLKSHAWFLDPSKAELPILGEFISLHDKWAHVEILALKAEKSVDLGLGSITAIVQRLPSLKHLMLSGIHPADFNDATLLRLPGLRSLRLENLAGLTDQGVQQLAFSPLAPSLQRLALIGLDILSLQTVQTLLTHLARLRRFIFAQESSPEPLIGVDASGRALVLESKSLRHLHWDCITLGTATSSFAEAIANGHFPSLRSVRVPCDYDGLVQAVCRPIPQVKPTPEDVEYLARHPNRTSVRSMKTVRLHAQQRISENRERPAINVVIQDESNQVRHSHVIGSYLGNLQSKVTYLLESEMGDNALTQFDDITRPKSKEGGNVLWEQKMDLRAVF